jgi:hypothetical protein
MNPLIPNRREERLNHAGQLQPEEGIRYQNKLPTIGGGEQPKIQQDEPHTIAIMISFVVR